MKYQRNLVLLIVLLGKMVGVWRIGKGTNTLVMNNLGQMVMEASFFKDSWEVTGPSVIEAALHFFNSSKMLKQLNPTTL